VSSQISLSGWVLVGARWSSKAAAAAILIVLQNAVLYTALAQTQNPPMGMLKTLYDYGPDINQNYPNGASPSGGFILGNDGYFYGTTRSGGAFGAGTIYRISTFGGLQLLHSFNGGSEGGGPVGPLATDGNAIYGTTLSNIAFRITTGGDFTSFGALPGGTANVSANGLAYANNGNFYGTSVNNSGTNVLFRLTPISPFGSVIVNGLFQAATGIDDGAPLAQGLDGSLYAATSSGVYKIVIAGMSTMATAVYRFTQFESANQGQPTALVAGPDGALYGTTGSTIFQLMLPTPALPSSPLPAAARRPPL
jgi:uncharacterized repeat protein (TIGR03803 family)